VSEQVHELTLNTTPKTIQEVVTTIDTLTTVSVLSLPLTSLFQILFYSFLQILINKYLQSSSMSCSTIENPELKSLVADTSYISNDEIEDEQDDDEDDDNEASKSDSQLEKVCQLK
jgi:hypothetical protein